MVNRTWSIAEAKSKLSEVLNRAEREAQIITRRDRQFVVLESNEYRRITGERPDLKEVLLSGPGLEGVDLERDRSLIRELEL